MRVYSPPYNKEHTKKGAASAALSHASYLLLNMINAADITFAQYTIQCKLQLTPGWCFIITAATG